MKRRKPFRITTALLAMLLACLLMPSYALAASTRSNDNHTDTGDYCLRAHDVIIGLSEFQSKSRAELESDIVSASAFAFLIRDTASGTGEFVPVTSGYSVDFSNLTEAASSGGYTVAVSLPAITLSEPSRIIFRVYVEDDLPQPRTVRYLFESGALGHSLPEDVAAQLPAEEIILSGTPVTPSGSFSPVREGDGEWTFSGWIPESITLSDSDVTFTGVWIYAPLPVYQVTYTFVSGTGGRTLPDGVLANLPPQAAGVDGDTFTAPETFRSFHTAGGTWRFRGWDSYHKTISGGDLTFTGEWRWYVNHAAIKTTAAPTSTPTLAPTPTPTAAPSAAPAAITSAPIPPPDQSLEQVPSDAPIPAANSTAGGTAQMVIAAVLTALVASQAFAIAGDLKVLKWYDAKKAARRAGV